MERISWKAVDRGAGRKKLHVPRSQDQESRPQPKGGATEQCVLGPGEHWGGGREGGRGQMNHRALSAGLQAQRYAVSVCGH